MSLWYTRLTVKQIEELSTIFSEEVNRIVPDYLRPHLSVNVRSTRQAFHFRAEIEFGSQLSGGREHFHVLIRAHTKADILDLNQDSLSPIVIEGKLNPKIRMALRREMSERMPNIRDDFKLNKPLLDHWIGQVSVSRGYRSPRIQVTIDDLTEQEYERLLEHLPRALNRPDWPSPPVVGKSRYSRKEPV